MTTTIRSLVTGLLLGAFAVNSMSAVIDYEPGVSVKFGPSSTVAGINVGSIAGDPSSPVNGDLWYDSTANELTARINGANVALGAGGSSTLTSTYVGYGSGANAVTGEAAFAYDSTFNILSVDAIKLFATGVGISAASSGVLKLEGLGSGFDEAINMDFDTTSNVVQTSSPATGVTIMDYLDMSLRVTDGGGNFATLGPSGITVHNSAWAGNYTLAFGGTDGDAETIASREGAQTFTGQNTFSLPIITPTTEALGATTALVANKSYSGTIDTRTVTISAAASYNGSHIHFLGTAAGSTVITWPATTVRQIGGSGYASTTTFAAGNVEFDLWSNGTDWYLSDSSGTAASSGAPTDATYITQTANGTLTNEQALGSLATGIVKNTTTTGVLSIATAGADYGVPSDTAYDATSWNGNTDVPTKNAVRDKIESMSPTTAYGIIGFTSSDTAVATGKVKGFVVCPYAGTISGWSIVTDAGTATVKVWKIASGTAKPTIANVINTAGVAISSGTAVISTTTSDFTTTTVTANDIFAFDITAASGVAEITFQLRITKS